MITNPPPLSISAFKGLVTSTPDLFLTESEASDNQNITTDEVVGTLKKLPGFIKTGSIGSKLIVHDCESVWTSGDTTQKVSNVTTTLDSTTTVIGTYTNKIVIDAAFTTGIAAYTNFSAKNLSGYTSVGFYVKFTTAVSSGEYEFVLSETAAGVTPAESIDIPTIAANTWYYVNLNFASSTITTRDAIISIGINVPVNIAANTIYIDNIEAFRSDFFPVELCETAWTASAEVTSTADTSTTIGSATITPKQGTYDSKNVITADFTTGVIAHKDITAINISEFKRIGLWIYSTIDLKIGDLSVQLSDSVGLEEDMAIDVAIVANSWTYVTVPMADPASNYTITIIGLNSNRDQNIAHTIFIDDIRALKPVKTISEYFQTDGSRKLMASDGQTVWTSTDGVSFTPIASGFNSSYDHEFCTYDGDSYFTNGSDWVMSYTDAEQTVVFNAAHGAPFWVPRGRHIWNHQGATLMIGYAEGNLATVYYTDEAKLPTEAGWFSNTFAKDLALDTGDYITYGLQYGERTVIFLNRIYYVLTGEQGSNFDWMPRNLGIGCTLGRSVQIKDNCIVFSGEDGIYRMDESFSAIRISDAVQPTVDKFQQALVNYGSWVQAIEEDFAAGTVGTNLFDYTGAEHSGALKQRVWQSKADWQTGTLSSEADVDTITDAVTIKNYNTTILNPSFENSFTNWTSSVVSSYGSVTGVNVWEPLARSLPFWYRSEVWYPTHGAALAHGRVSIQRPNSSKQPNSKMRVEIIGDSFLNDLYDFDGYTLGSNGYNSGGAFAQWKTFAYLPTCAIGTTLKIAFTLFISYNDPGVSVSGSAIKLESDSFVWRGGTIAFNYANYTEDSTPQPGVTNMTCYGVIDNIVLLGNTNSYSPTAVTWESPTIKRVTSAPDVLGNFVGNMTIPSGSGISLSVRTAATDLADWTTATIYPLPECIDVYNFKWTDVTSVTMLEYFRIYATLVSNSPYSTAPVLKLLVPCGGTFISQVNDIGTTSGKWSTFETSHTLNSQTINYFTRSATTSGLLATADWHEVTAGQTIPEADGNRWVQWRAELNTNKYNEVPYIDSVVMNWVTSSSSTIPTTKPASIVYDNRYYMFGQIQGDKYSNTGLCIDKLWQFQNIKDYPVGSLSTFIQKPYFGSSVDGNIFILFSGLKMDYGNVDNIKDIESFWITGRFGAIHKGQDKWFKETNIFFEPQSIPGTLDVSYDINNSGIFISLGSVDLTQGDGEQRYLYPGFVCGRDIKYKFYIDDPVDLTLYRVLTNYNVKERTF